MTSEALSIHADTATRKPPAALFSLGFRPFYLLAAFSALLLVPCWLLVYFGILPQHAAFAGGLWHAHEMLFGYTAAVVVGFLYTAVPNWTGRKTPQGTALAGLAALWLAGRVAMLIGGALPPLLVAAIDLAFLPLAALGALLPLWRKRNWRNIGFAIGLLAATLLNLCMHLDAMGLAPGAAATAIEGALAAVTVLLVVMTARVVPFFTGNALPDAGARRLPRLDAATLAIVVVALAARLVLPETAVAAGLAFAAAALLVGRMALWGTLASFRNPMLWVLHLGHLWIAIGFVLEGAYALGAAIPATLPAHALTVGAIGGLTLGMMARSGLGHSGRRIVAGPLLATAFVAINIAAWARTLAPAMMPSHYERAMVISASFWSLAFALFLIVMVPVCIRPRADAVAR
jgi:uncharacterized protein involved in response to NO